MKNQFEFAPYSGLEQFYSHGKRKWIKGKPVISFAVLALIMLGCLLAELIMTKDPKYLDLLNYNKAPNAEFIFGTDTLGRDMFSMIWYGGRISLFIGIFSTVISTAIGIILGTLSAISPKWLDMLIMRFTEIVLSIPGVLLIFFLQALLGSANIVSISLVIGVCSWPSISKVVRTEIMQMRNNEYVMASRTLGGHFFHILWHHFIPGLVSSIMFMVVMNVRNAIIAESTLSFIGIGLPVEVITWGSMLSLADKAILTGSWWILVMPGLFLIVTIFCMTQAGNALRRNLNKRHSFLCNI